MQGLPPTIDTAALWQIVGIASDAELNAFYAKYGKDVAYSFRHVPEQFARMLAKIGLTPRPEVDVAPGGLKDGFVMVSGLGASRSASGVATLRWRLAGRAG